MCKKYAQGILFITLLLVACSCGKNYTPEQKTYISRIEKFREAKDNSFKNDDDSPFNHKSKIHFDPLKYYDVDPSFVFHSKLYEFPIKDTIKVYRSEEHTSELQSRQYLVCRLLLENNK